MILRYTLMCGLLALASPGQSEGIGDHLRALGPTHRLTAVTLEVTQTGHLVAQVTLNGITGRFLVDTGAAVTVVDAARIDSFGLDAGEPLTTEQTAGAAGILTVRVHATGPLRIGTAETPLPRIYSSDLRYITEAISAGGGGHIDGIIGQDILLSQRAIIDVAGATLYLQG